MSLKVLLDFEIKGFFNRISQNTMSLLGLNVFGATGQEFKCISLSLPITQTCGDVVLRLFMEVTVQLSLDSSNVQHEKLALRLVRPNIQGFSVEPTPPAAAPMETEEGRFL